MREIILRLDSCGLLSTILRMFSRLLINCITPFQSAQQHLEDNQSHALSAEYENTPLDGILQ